MHPCTRIIGLAIAAAIELWAGNLYSAKQVSVQLIGPVGVGAINQSGQAVGWYMPPMLGNFHAFLYSGGVVTLLPSSTAVAINDEGEVVGQYCEFGMGGGFGTCLEEAYSWKDGVVTLLGYLPGSSLSYATGINNQRQIVGSSVIIGPKGPAFSEAFLWDDGVMTSLGTLSGFSGSVPAAINSQGQVVGTATQSNGSSPSEAFLYSGGVMTGLGALPGTVNSAGTSINDLGQIVGYSDNGTYASSQGFLYSQGKMAPLGTLPGCDGSAAEWINNKGHIVGSAHCSIGKAFLDRDGKMIDLNTVTILPVGAYLSEATRITDAGQIIANGLVLTPIKGRLVPVTPCRVVDTRLGPGDLGGPSMGADSTRSFAIPESPCGIPSTATAYSLNVTVVPQRPLGYLTLWPTGLQQPAVSTLNSWQGDVVANAAIVPAGQNGAVSVYATDPTDVILDIDGYFEASSGDSFYPLPPCRVVDTRLPPDSSANYLRAPWMENHTTRSFPVLSGVCGLPTTATAYSMNVTAVPFDVLLYLALWPTGQPQPFVSTLNAQNGGVVANAAIVPAGTGGAVSVYVTNRTNVVLDTNGYFAPPGGTGALSFYPVAPCRVADTREANGPFGGPIVDANTLRTFAMADSDCDIPDTAAAYSLNVTVVPDGPLSYLTAWPAGLPLPFVSTLNSIGGTVTANAAIVPAGANGAISIYVTNRTHVILDINGYFAP